MNDNIIDIDDIDDIDDNRFNCTICLKDDIHESSIYNTNCSHTFCKECLDDWFKRGNSSCPLCRNDIITYNHNGINYHLIIHSSNDRINRELLITSRNIPAFKE